MTSAIKLTNLTKKFGDFTAVNKINLDVPKGEIYGFVGPNGAGKTTTIKSIIGSVTPTEGEIYLNGFDVRKKSAEALVGIGYIPETTTSLYFDMKAEKFINYIGQLKGLPSKDARKETDYLLDLVGMTFAKNRKIGNMSTGMKQRVNIAQALIGDPEILIADEPTLGLDPVGKRDFQNLLLKIKEMGKTVFISSHILDELEKVLTQVSVITRGEITFTGTFEELNREFKPDIYYLQTNNVGLMNNIISNHGVEIIEKRQIGSVIKLRNGKMNKLIGDMINNNLDIQELRSEDSPLKRLFFDNVSNKDSQDSFNFSAQLKQETK